MSSLSNKFRPQTHDAPITAADFDATSQTVVTADAQGNVTIRHKTGATHTLKMNAAVRAINLSRGGERVAIGDDNGNIGVYDTRTSRNLFLEERFGAAGRSRAFQGVALNPQGSRLASISKDQILRVWDLQKKERLFQWKDFSGASIYFDSRGERILAITTHMDSQISSIYGEIKISTSNTSKLHASMRCSQQMVQESLLLGTVVFISSRYPLDD